MRHNWMIFKLSKFRPLLPIVVGLLLGFSMSIIRMPINHEDCVHLTKDHIDRKLKSLKEPQEDLSDKDLQRFGYKPMGEEEADLYRKDRVYAPPVHDLVDDFEPRIITDPELKPKITLDQESNKKKVVRPRYISTELGIRNKLICGVLTSSSTLLSLGVALNQTFSHHMQKVIFFEGLNQLSVEKSATPAGMSLVTYSSSHQIRVLYETLSHLYMKYRDEYDWYFITTDSTYPAGDRINRIVDHISINRRLYLGQPLQHSDENFGTITYCSIQSGFFISRLLLLDIFPKLNDCKNGDDVDDIQSDQWLARCIKQATRGAVKCENSEEGVVFHTFNLEHVQHSFDVETETQVEFKNAVTVSGVETPQMMYKLHKRFSEIEIDLAYKEIVEIQSEIEQLAPKLPEGEPPLTWPIGINAPFRPTNRWDIIVWDYFTEDFTLTCPGEIPKCELNGIDKLDIQNIIQIALNRLNEKYNPKGLILEKKKLINGYRRFDPQRGMEYILDLLLNVIIEDENEEIELSHRVDLLRPLTEVEIIPMPYVTESAKVNIILPLTIQQRPYFQKFFENFVKGCLNTGENAALSIVFIYDPHSAQKIKEDDAFAAQKKILQEHEVSYKKDKDGQKLIPWISIKTELPSQLKVMDIEAKKYANDALFLMTSVAANLNQDFLNRCRMNTIAGWQAFFPIPFSQYNPEIIYKNVPVPDQIEIKPSTGHFDIYSFDEICIYNSDYMSAKTLLTQSIRSQDTPGSISESVDSLDIYDMLVKYSQLHIFRAVEPQLTRRYVHRNCNQRNGPELYKRCERSNAEGLASRTQLAMELFPDDVNPK